MSLHRVSSLVAPRSAVMQSAVLSCLLPMYLHSTIVIFYTVLPMSYPAITATLLYYTSYADLHVSISYYPRARTRYLPTLPLRGTSLLMPPHSSRLPCTTPCHSCMSSPEVGGLLTDALPSPFSLQTIRQCLSNRASHRYQHTYSILEMLILPLTEG